MGDATLSCLGRHRWPDREEPPAGEDRARPGRSCATGRRTWLRPVDAGSDLLRLVKMHSERSNAGFPSKRKDGEKQSVRHRELRPYGGPAAEASAAAVTAFRTGKPMLRGYETDLELGDRTTWTIDATSSPHAEERPILRRQSLRARASRRPSMWRRTSGLSICSSETQRPASSALGTREPMAAFVGRSLKKSFISTSRVWDRR